MRASRSADEADLGPLEDYTPEIVARLADVNPSREYQAPREHARAPQVRTHVSVEVQGLSREIEQALEDREAAAAHAVLVSGHVRRRMPVLVEEDSGIGSFAHRVHLHRRVARHLDL